MRYQGLLYRALNPIYAKEPLSGRGAELYGGRFNAKGTAALYLSIEVLTAVREANQVGTLQPTTMVAYEADIEDLFDCRDPSALFTHGWSPDDLAAPTWRDEMKTSGRSRTQAFSADLEAAGFAGLVVRSFAKGSSDTDLNVVLWHWTDDLPHKLKVIDDEGRLTKS